MKGLINWLIAAAVGFILIKKAFPKSQFAAYAPQIRTDLC
jgi:hypothetical protein